MNTNTETMNSKRYPDVGECVLGEVRRVAEMGAYVYLPEYDREGMILFSELSPDWFDGPHTMRKLVKAGQQIVVKVIRVDTEKDYIDLSKTKVTPEDITNAEERYKLYLA